MEESPIMKAWREFAMADPNNCDREYDAYMALVNNTAIAAVPIGGISGRAAATPSSTLVCAISSTTPAAATPASSSTSVSTPATKDDLSPEARRVYDYLVGNSAVPPTTDISTNLWVSAEHEDLAALTPSTCSTVCLGCDTSVTMIPSPQRAIPASPESAPASATTVSTMLPSPTEIQDVQDAVAADLVASAPTACSMKRPSHDAAAYVAALTPFTTPTWSMNSGGIVPEPAATELRDKALDMDVTGDNAPSVTICLSGDPDDSIGGEDTMSVSLTPWKVHTALNELPRPPHVLLIVLELCTWSPSSTDCSCRSIEMSSRLLNEAYKEFKSTVAPWPPPCAGTSLIHGEDLFHHVRQKRVKEFSVQDTKGNWHGICLSMDLKPPWPSLGVCMPPMGYALFSLGSIAANDDSSTDVNSCLDDVLWKLPRWRSENQFVRPYTICDVPSRLWITSRLAEVQFQFSYPLVPVSSHFGREYFQLSRSPQMNVDSNSGTILDLSMSLNGPFLSFAELHQEFMRIYNMMSWPCYRYATCSRILPKCWHDPPRVRHTNATLKVVSWSWIYHHILLVISWFPVDRCQLFLGLFCVVQGYTSSSGFFTILNGEATLQQCYTYTRVLTVAMHTRWVYHHILRGPEYFDSHCAVTKEQTMNILALSYPEGFLVVLCITNKALVLIIGCKSRSMGCSNRMEIVTAKLLDVYNMLTRWNSNQFPLDLYGIKNWLIQWDPGDDLVRHLLSVTSPRAPLSVSRPVDMSFPYVRVLEKKIHDSWGPGSCNGRMFEDSPGHDLMEKLSSLSINCELHFSSLVLDDLLAALYWVWCMRCQQLDIARPSKCVIFLQPEPPWTYSCSDFERKMMGHLDDVLVQDRLRCIIRYGFEVNQWNSAWWFNVDHYSDETKVSPLSFANILQGSLSDDCSNLGHRKLSWDPGIWPFFCIYGFFACTAAQGGIMVATPTYCYTRYNDVYLEQASFSQEYYIDLVSVLPNHMYDNNHDYQHDSSKIHETHVPWDPGGSTWSRLGVKPNFKGWGLSTTCLHGLTNGPPSWAMACLGTKYGGGRWIYIPAERAHGRWLGTERMASAWKARIG